MKKVEWLHINVGSPYSFFHDGKCLVGILVECGRGRYLMETLGSKERVWVTDLYYAAAIGDEE